MLDHDPRLGRRAPERKRKGASSDTSGQSDEPLCPIQPVFDGFPGSMGYDDVRSLHSTIHSHSPTGGAQSPTHSYGSNPWTYERSIEREELTAARLKSQLHPSSATVVSYGPNPVTPTLTPRLTPRVNVSSVVTPVSPIGTDGVPYVPTLSLSDYSDYNNSYTKPDTKPSPPRQPPVPIVVSYGPNKVTPTPVVFSPTVPPDEMLVSRRLAEAAHTATGPGIGAPLERQFSWEADSSLLGASSMGPLPPYASTEDFEAMEKGAVRKLAEPQAEAELPPTKDGFYHYTSDVVEYELPGAAPQREPQLPFRPYHNAVQHHPLAGGVGGAGGNGAAGGPSSSSGVAGRAGFREIDEQKFLLSDEEIARLRVEKAKIRAGMAAKAAQEQQQQQQQRQQGESYDLGEPMERVR
jgi:hypothetical protein